MPKVLIIDDEPVVASAIHRHLRDILPTSWAVEHVTDADLGLSRLVVDRQVHICFVDLIMPKIGGEELIRRAHEARPEMRGHIVLCTGWPIDDEARRLFTEELGCELLEKPFGLERIEQLVWRMIEELPPPTAPTAA